MQVRYAEDCFRDSKESLKAEKRESFLFSMAQYDTTLKKKQSKILLEKKLL